MKNKILAGLNALMSTSVALTLLAFAVCTAIVGLFSSWRLAIVSVALSIGAIGLLLARLTVSLDACGAYLDALYREGQQPTQQKPN